MMLCAFQTASLVAFPHTTAPKLVARPPHRHERTSRRRIFLAQPSDRLYSHTLQCIFAFLALRELHCTRAVSNLWLSDEWQIRSVGAPLLQLPPLLGSSDAAAGAHTFQQFPLTRRHTVEFDQHPSRADVAAVRSDAFPAATQYSLPNEPSLQGQSVVWPRSLRALRVWIPRERDSKHVSAAVESIIHLPLLEEPSLGAFEFSPDVQLAPLTRLLPAHPSLPHFPHPSAQEPIERGSARGCSIPCDSLHVKARLHPDRTAVSANPVALAS